MDLQTYINNRFDQLSDETINILNLKNDDLNRLFLETMWTKQFYDQLIKEKLNG